MKILYLTDVHGNTPVFKKALAMAEKHKISHVIFGGDIAPKKGAIAFNKEYIFTSYGDWYKYDRSIENMGFSVLHTKKRVENLKAEELLMLTKKLIAAYSRQQVQYVKSLMKLFAERSTNIYIMPGNDDVKEIMPVLKKAEKRGIIRQLHMAVHKLNGMFIAGYACVNPTPFRLKDWERNEKAIALELDELAEKSRPEKTIYVMHAPPKNTHLDLMHTGGHIGSSSVRHFIERYQPLLTLHGHIHESPEMSSRISQKIGSTLSVNPGSSEMILNALAIDLKTLKMRKGK